MNHTQMLSNHLQIIFEAFHLSIQVAPHPQTAASKPQANPTQKLPTSLLTSTSHTLLQSSRSSCSQNLSDGHQLLGLAILALLFHERHCR